MKVLCLVLCLSASTLWAGEEPTFRWSLPAPAEAQKLTPEAFPGSDAVIIVKEQGYTEGPHTKSLFAIYNDVTATAECMVIKLFNQKAVEKFGSFISGSGSSRAPCTVIDSFLTLQPRNHFLRSFRDNFTAPIRHYDVDLNEPFAWNLKWEIAVPRDYRVDHVPEATDIAGPAGASAQISYHPQDGVVEVNAMVVFTAGVVPLEKYAEWRTFLDNVNSTIERPVVFRKVGG